MKLKILLFSMFVVWFGAYTNAQSTAPYNNLIITEFRDMEPTNGYVEITNKGNRAIDLSEFELGTMWINNDIPWVTSQPEKQLRLPATILQPGESWVVSEVYDFGPYMWTIDPLHYEERYTKPEMATLSDLVLHRAEENGVPGLDSISPKWQFIGRMNQGSQCVFLRHYFTNPETNEADSMVIDQVNGIFSDEDGTKTNGSVPVAGVETGAYDHTLIRRNYVTTGVTDFSSHEANNAAAAIQFENNAGLGLDDSEWMPIPRLATIRAVDQWRAAFWTVGNSVNAVIDEHTLEPKEGSNITVDLDGGTITVPWGIRNDDSIMYKFKRKQGLAWHYTLSPAFEDSAYLSIRTGDKLTIYACGDKLSVKEFSLIVREPIASENRVIPKNTYDYYLKRYPPNGTPYSGMRVSENDNTMDTISRLDYATRVDTLFKYLEKPSKASWKIVFKDGNEKPDLQTGDILRVTSESGQDKDYYIKLAKYLPSSNAYLGSITWPDMPKSFKEISSVYGWIGDTIPNFGPQNFDLVVLVPYDYQGIPQIVFTKQDLNSKVVVNRAKNINGSVADRTATFTVTAEDGSTKNVYSVRFDVEKDPDNIQSWSGEPFISRWIYSENWGNGWIQICNPGTEPLDLSNYMIACGEGDPIDVFNTATSVNKWEKAYDRYIPGKKWQDQADWQVTPCIVEPDYAINPIVQSGDVFVITSYSQSSAARASGYDDTPFRSDIDIDFFKNPWGRDVPIGENASTRWNLKATYCMWKILNDSVTSGLKPATDIGDFELIDVLGTGGAREKISFGGVTVPDVQSIERKPEIFKGNPVVMGSSGTDEETNEWLPATNSAYWIALGFPEWGDSWCLLPSGIGAHAMDEVTFYKSTVSSTVYKVSPGFSPTETIKGLVTGVTVESFYANIIKADENQTLKTMSGDTELSLTDAVSNGNKLVVLSADSTNTTNYILYVTSDGLSNDAKLTSDTYTIEISGSTGVVGGFEPGTLLKDVFAGVVVPNYATLTITDDDDAYLSLSKLNYDTAYVDVIATSAVNFVVVAEDGNTTITYQLLPTSDPNDVYVTSDVYSVDQDAALIQFVPEGTTESSLMLNVTPSPEATIQVLDRMNFVRENGRIYKDDKLVVTAKDGIATKAYFLSMLSNEVTTYLAYVVSDDYTVDQIDLTISGVETNTVAEFFEKLNPSFGATLSILDKDGNVSTSDKLNSGDKLLVTAADKKTTTTYHISNLTNVSTHQDSFIKIYPNPTADKVIIHGLSKGNRVRVFNSSGITLRDVTVDSSTEHVSLATHPAGLYIFVISSGEKFINIQKVIKK